MIPGVVAVSASAQLRNVTVPLMAEFAEDDDPWLVEAEVLELPEPLEVPADDLLELLHAAANRLKPTNPTAT